MNKIFKTASFVAGTLLIAMSSCKKATEVTPVESLGSGTVKGQVFYDSDETDDDTNSDIPSGATVRYSYVDANTNETIIGTTSVNGSGEYSFSVPTDEDGVDVDISIDDFEGDYTFEYLNDDGDERVATESGYYAESVDFATKTVLPGKTSIVAKETIGGFTSFANPSLID